MPTPATAPAPQVIIAPNSGDLVQSAWVTVTATSKPDALMVAMDALDAHAAKHGWTVSIQSYETTQLPDGQYRIDFS